MNISKIKNFWYYNWITIAVIVFVIVFSVLTFTQCSQRTECDLGIMYAGKSQTADTLPHLGDRIKAGNFIEDADDDGNITVKTASVIVPESETQIMKQQVMEQIQVELIAGENVLYILNERVLKSFAVDENFLDITSYYQKYTGGKYLAYPDGRVYAVALDGNALLEGLDIESGGMYIAVRNYAPEDAGKIMNMNALGAMEFILQNGGNTDGK